MGNPVDVPLTDLFTPCISEDSLEQQLNKYDTRVFGLTLPATQSPTLSDIELFTSKPGTYVPMFYYQCLHNKGLIFIVDDRFYYSFQCPSRHDRVLKEKWKQYPEESLSSFTIGNESV
jgi:hypothetical protein